MPVTEGGIAGTSMTGGDGKVITETFDVKANDFKFNVQLSNLNSSSRERIEMKFESDGSFEVVKHETTGNYIWAIPYLQFSSQQYFASDDIDGNECVSCFMDDDYPKLEEQDSGKYMLTLQFKVPDGKTCIFYEPVLKYVYLFVIAAAGSVIEVDGSAWLGNIPFGKLPSFIDAYLKTADNFNNNEPKRQRAITMTMEEDVKQMRILQTQREKYGCSWEGLEQFYSGEKKILALINLLKDTDAKKLISETPAPHNITTYN